MRKKLSLSIIIHLRQNGSQVYTIEICHILWVNN